MNLILTSDFVGRWNVSSNKFEEEDFQDYINSYTDDIMNDLLGCNLYTLFNADLLTDPDGRDVPQSVEYLNIYNAICDDSLSLCCCGNSVPLTSYGMQDMLKSMIRFYWLRDQKYKQTISGTSIMDSENSVVIKSLHYGLTRQFNRGIESYQSIQCYIENNKITYPTYSGKCKELTSWL